MKWLLATALALFLFSGAMPYLKKFGIGRLPGDFNFRMFNREWSIPLASTLLLSFLTWGIVKLF
jgi:Protein of unknown function (DUF2905)